MGCVVPLPSIEHNLTVCAQGYEKESSNGVMKLKRLSVLLLSFRGKNDG